MFWIDGMELEVGRHREMAESWCLTRTLGEWGEGVSRRDAETRRGERKGPCYVERINRSTKANEWPTS